MSNKVPQIRFNGYSDAWEERKLGEVGKAKSGIGFPDAQQGGKQGTPFYKVSDMNNPGNEVVMMSANNYASDSQLRENKWNPINPQNSGVVFAKVGAAIFLDRKRIVDTSFLIDNNMMSYLFDSSWNRYFGKTLFEKLRLSRFAQVGALPSFNGSDVEDIKVMIPEESEQKVIGDMFEKLDDTIALHQRKLDLLKEQKKGYLQKMFPKNGAKVPELRFAGFADDWEERKLRDLLNKNSEKNKNLSVINVESVSNKTGFTKQTDQFEDYSVASADLSNYYVIREKQFAYNPSRINVGSIAYKDLGDEISVVSPLYVSFSTKKVLNDGFLWNWFKTASFDAQRQRLSEGGVRDTLSFNQLSEMNTMFPTYPEQEKIGSFFKQLDNTIALHQRKLELLKEQKKGFLQKMFV